MTDENISQMRKRRRISRVQAADAAIQHQRQLASDDSHELYTLSMVSFPLKFAEPVLHKSIESSRFLLNSDSSRAILSPDTHDKIDSAVTKLENAIKNAATVYNQAIAETQDKMQKRRLREFRNDFKQPPAKTVKRNLDCLICNCTATRVHVLQCCSTTDNQKTICLPCLQRMAFFSSKHGTEKQAACPFCVAKFNVYREIVTGECVVGERKSFNTNANGSCCAATPPTDE